MKRIIFSLLTIFLVFLLFCSCSQDLGNVGFTPNSNENLTNSHGYRISDLVANISSAKALGIIKKNVGAGRRGDEDMMNILIMTTSDDTEGIGEEDYIEVSFSVSSKESDSSQNPSSNDIVNQESLSEEIDKLFVRDGFSLVSYTKKGASERPSEITYASNEITGQYNVYDLTGYSTNSERSSYIISNETGRIYPLPEGQVFGAHNGIFFENSLGPVSFSLSDSDELVVDALVRNRTIRIMDYFKDQYGKIYILNDSLDGIDSKNPNVMYFTWAGTYVPTRDGRVVYFSYEEGIVYCSPPQFTGAWIVGEHFDDKINITRDDVIEFNYKPYTGFGEGFFYTGYAKYACIRDGYVYTWNDGSWYNYGRYNLTTGERTNLRFSTGGSYSGFIGHLDYHTVLVGWNKYTVDKSFALYCFDPYECGENLEWIDKEYFEAHMLLEKINYLSQQHIYADCYAPFSWEFRVDNFDETKYYRIVPDENASCKYSLRESNTVLAEDRKIILLPL